jgi:hypothetical protein
MGINPILLSDFQSEELASAASFCITVATTFSWVNITPFGTPVVPDEYTRYARSSLGLI